MTNHYTKHRPLFNSILTVLAGAMLTACERPSDETVTAPAEGAAVVETTKTMQIEAFYRERMLLPAGSELIIALEDVSRMDVAATRISEQVLIDPGAPPFRVALSYPADKIDERHRYGLRAQIRNADRLLFTNTHHIDPFAGDQPIQVLMARVSRPPESPQSQ